MNTVPHGWRLAATALTLALSACATPRPGAPININLVALNDFHGHLEAGKFTYTSARDKTAQTIQAGGIDTLAAALKAWRLDDPELLLVGAGDIVGASPAASSMWADEPSIIAMNMLGLRASSLGNHEFDQGRVELLRQQNGGCSSPRPDKACKFAPTFEGARFPYLAANVIDQATGKTLMPAYRIEQAHGVKVGLIGAVLKDLPSVVTASSIAGLSFVDEADAINKTLPELRAQGATVFVVLIHEGGKTTDFFDQPDCEHLQGPIVDIVRRLDPAIRLVITGHSHKAYQCKVDGRVVTQSEMGGHVLARIALAVDPATRALRDISVRNVVMKAGEYPADANAVAYLQTVRERSAAALARPIARVAVRSVSRKGNEAGETPLGDLIADAMLAATGEQGAQVVFMNTGGIRKDFDIGESLVATFGQAQIVLPFSNTLVLMDLTGAQIRELLEQQWREPEEESILQVSKGFAYRWDGSQAKGKRIVPGSLALNGVPIEDAKTYRVGANNFLAEGGDNFPVFAKGTRKADTGIVDLDAFVAYLAKRDSAGAPAGSASAATRIERVK